MFLLTFRDRKDDGAYAVQDDHGDKVLFLFEQEDDANRYVMMMEDNGQNDKNMAVIEIDGELAIKTCKMYNYKYEVIKPNDFVIPTKNDNISED